MKFKRIILVLFFVGFIFVVGGTVEATGLGDAFGKNLTNAATEAQYKTTDMETIVAIVIKSILGLLGVIFLVLMIYGGFLWMTAKGNEQQVEKAKNLISAAIIGLIIVLSSYAISVFIIKRVGDATLNVSSE
ncbi:hypothetical protein K8R32_05075 [bacterium]|nr:hypothetical protein [bacterium]